MTIEIQAKPPTYEQALSASTEARREITAGIDDCQLCGAAGMWRGPRAVESRGFWCVQCETCGVQTGPHDSRAGAVQQWHLIDRRTRSEVAQARRARVWRRVCGWLRSMRAGGTP